MKTKTFPLPGFQKIKKLKVFWHALAFVLGFTFIFVVGWGGAATLLGGLFSTYKLLIARVGGVVVILFGLATLGWVRIPWFYFDTRPEMQQVTQKKGIGASAMMGVFFAAGWSPCIGATLGAILTLSYTQGAASQAMFLSGIYALGLGIPFLLMGLGLEKARTLVQKLGKHLQTLKIISAIFLITIGVLILTNRMTLIAIWAQRNGLFIDIPLGAGTPNIMIAFTAGLLSFLSPCVLPLVPAYISYLSLHALEE